MSDPMTELAGIIDNLIMNAKENHIFLGKVISISPWKIKVNDMILDSDNVFISGLMKELISGHLIFKNDLKYKISAGDSVVMLKSQDRFIIIDRVVNV